MKKTFSIAQRKHQHKFITIGAVEGMRMRLRQLIEDKAIPSGSLKQSLIFAYDHISQATKDVRSIEIDERYI
jgi:hypothetical protein